MERSFKKEVEALKLGNGETFHGEGILAVTKALLQSGVSYVGGYQGAPVSHLLDVMVDAEDLLHDLGVHVETCTNEASAAAMLGASISYPLRGAVTWKSVVGTNVAADALSNLASPGVVGGAMIIIGEDYGEGASIIQERSYAFAMKCSMWLLDPRPDLTAIVRTVEKGFELSEASNTPVMLELRIRACHVTGSFTASDNRRGRFSGQNRIAGPPRHDYIRLSHPPSTFIHEKQKVEQRLPAAQAYIREHKLNEVFPGDLADVGIIVLGGLYNGVLRALERLGLADLYGNARIPMYVLNVAYPLVPDEVKAFCAGKRAVLVVEEGNPDYLEQQINTELRRADIQTRVLGKGCLPPAGEYNSEPLIRGLAQFVSETRPAGIDADAISGAADAMLAHKPGVVTALGDIPPRPPNFCTGCPERPVFSAIKLVQREVGATHISADIGCHSFSTLPPFSFGNSILGYGMSLASAAAVGPNFQRRTISIMGDGGFWHNGLVSGVASNLFNQGDGVLIIMQNGYTSATGQQYLPTSRTTRSGTPTGMTIEKTLRAFGVKWLRTVYTYNVATMMKTVREALHTAERGLKVIIADGECMLARQRRIRADEAEKLKRGERVTRARYGVDDEICTGDHSCIRLSGCPSLTVKPSPDPLRTDPVASVIESCVGCGLCGEVAEAAVLCPSFYRAEIIRNPNWWDRTLHGVRQTVIGWFARPPKTAPAAQASPEGGAQTIVAPAAEPSSDGVKDDGAAAERTPSFWSDAPQAGAAAAARIKPASGTTRPISLLVAALGGEGGGVLTNWIIAAAAQEGLPAQSTSIPGVAQRTGATTYYIEVVPTPWRDLGGKRPVLALSPGVGDVDVVIASELLEAGRAIANGFVTRDRTLLIGSTSRSYLVTEKMAMGDGRFDGERVLKAIEQQAQTALLFDMEDLAKQSGTIVNAVMLGLIAGSGRLPISVASFEAAIRAEGKAAEGNLRGFRAGLEAARAGRVAPGLAVPGKRWHAPKPSLADIEREVAGSIPAAARDIVVEGVRRLAAYQDLAYVRRYLDRLGPVRAADERAGADGRLLRETARHLAVRMSFEDVIRVAQAKIEPKRFTRIAEEVKAKPGEPFVVTEFLKPGIEEICSVLPPALARPILDYTARRGWLGRVYFGMQVKTTSVSGYLRFWLLAKLRGWRPRSHRFVEEQAAIETWLGLVVEAARLSPQLALEIAECARLIKGYGDTHKRGSDNFRTIVEHVVRPVLAGAMPVGLAVDAIASARTAALADPDGESLARCLTEISQQPAFKIAAE
jgi:indolepyruvate ferredoxin oxidoreductase, alpha subunit